MHGRRALPRQGRVDLRGGKLVLCEKFSQYRVKIKEVIHISFKKRPIILYPITISNRINSSSIKLYLPFPYPTSLFSSAMIKIFAVFEAKFLKFEANNFPQPNFLQKLPQTVLNLYYSTLSNLQFQ